MSNRRIGVYICHCGGNISDYVDVEKVSKAVEAEPGVAVAKTAMFTCSDATQQEMLQDIKDNKLDGLVVASCSPKLHLFTFRDVAKRAGLNPYQYTQVNVREQCSWVHREDKEGATDKAVRLVRAGIAKTALTEPLNPIKIDTVPKVLVIGAGIAGLRASIGLSDLGLSVVLIEKTEEAGGWIKDIGEMYPHGNKGNEITDQLVDEVTLRENITMFTNAELVEKSGSIGNFDVKLRLNNSDSSSENISINVGSIVVATGFDTYQPGTGEYGYGIDGVVTLPEFRGILDKCPENSMEYNGKEINDVAYIYCVGSRQKTGGEKANKYCSRYCCNAAVHSSLLVSEKDPEIHQFHLCKDMRTYGKFESLYTKAMQNKSLFFKFDDTEIPKVEKLDDGRLKITVNDLVTCGESIEVEADLVVLVTGMVPKQNESLTDALKLPLGKDGFYNEIHPKLRPVETVVDGVYICGTCQAPKNSSESVASALSSVTQSASILKKGYVELEPLIASVKSKSCDGCADCIESCPYSAIEMTTEQGKDVARVNEALCKGCGGCVPFCTANALDLKGYTDDQMKSMINSLLKEIS